ncbi:tetratricopeptide repeat-containing sulfotransferase family protein [Tsuneonella amylolytica]|uniref:tetratricopeptide repeat-containing sulfotransferase family protein n=1 Tax=Tsuneonella amylolytica TaxID=2338327 RepID=UPI000EA9126F|nr:sulfotransferase [Tsuneonella amylolytica]
MTISLSLAAQDAERALAAGSTDPYDLLVAGLGRVDAGDEAGGDALLDRAHLAAPGDPGILTGVAIRRRQQGRLSEAVRLCDAAIAIAPDYPDAWLERGAILAAGGSSTAARDSFARAAALAPGNAAAHAGVASQAARDGDTASAIEAANRALALDPANLVAVSALGSALLETGDPAGALAAVQPVVETAQTGQQRSVAANTLGRIFEKLGRPDEAYRAFSLSKADFAAVNAPQDAGMPGHTAFVEAISGALATDGVTPPAAAAVPDRTPARAGRHLFLIGYPRSGTTLVENILASLPGVAALEEWPTFRDADEAFLTGDRAAIANGLQSFAQLDGESVCELQAAYWAVARSGGIAPASATFVDMDPLKATRLPFIARMFPDARVLVMRRDPRDVVWSCFRTLFAMTSGTLEYVTLERAARHYDAMMTLTDRALDRLPVAAHVVRYESVVRDFETETRALCAFAGLDWSEDVRRFDMTAKRRGVSTASAGQVRQGLYDGSGQWRPYAAYFEPVLPILDPWIERFGYDPA